MKNCFLKNFYLKFLITIKMESEDYLFKFIFVILIIHKNEYNMGLIINFILS